MAAKKEGKDLPQVISYLLMKQKFDHMYSNTSGVDKRPSIDSPVKGERDNGEQ